MKGRFGITGRLILIGLVGLFALFVVLGILLYQLRTQDGALRSAFPLPRQVAAMVRVLDEATPAQRTTLLQALNTLNISVVIVPDLPVFGPDTTQLRAVELLFSRQPGLEGRDVQVVAEERVRPVPGLRAWLSGIPLMVAVRLDDGDFVVIRARGLVFPRLLGVPSGFWLAAFSLVIAAFTLIALVRETRPLRQLTHALEQFSKDAVPNRVEPTGAADVRGLIATVNDMQERIGALVKGRTILAGAISHDLKTYLTRLQLRIEDLPEDRERQAAEADISAMLAIVDNALSLAKSATGDRHRDDFDLAVTIAQEAERARAAGQRVQTALSGDLTVFGDETALRRVLFNLVENAERHADAVWISAQHEDGGIAVHVDDNGPGIPEDERAAIFEPFYRLDPARNTQTGGSGLGLALCRQIVDSHGGQVLVTSSPRGGARFTVLLPKRPATDRSVQNGA